MSVLDARVEGAKRPAARSTSKASQRDPALEIFRGIAICEVVVHHVTGFARTNVHPDTPSHLLYAVLNRSLHFAVPAFLFLMAVLLTRSMVDRPGSWRRFYSRRSQQTLVPYLIWTALYVLYSLWCGRIGPHTLVSLRSWTYWLLWGKAWEHLYFLVLALQLYVAFPLLLGAARRTRVGLGSLLAVGALAQLGFYWAHQQWFRVPYPGTLLLWHLTPVLAGVWVGKHLDTWDVTWRRLRYLALAMVVGGWLAYLPQGLRELRGQPIHALSYQVAFWIYTMGMALCLLAFCRFLARSGTPVARGLQALGVQSMQIYLVHPLILSFWHRMPQTGPTLTYHLRVLTVLAIVLGLSLAISRLAARTRVGTLVFGRGDVPMAPLPARG